MKVKIEWNGVRSEHECEPSDRGAFLHGAIIAHLTGKTAIYGHPELFDKNGREIDIDETLEAAGVKDGDVLLFRPTVIR